MDELEDRTRRALLKALGGTAGLAAVGQASAHGWGEYDDESNANNTIRDGKPDTQGLSRNARVYGYHSLGDVGPASEAGTPDSPHYGGLTEIRTHGDYVYQAMFSARSETSLRGFAVIDAGEFVNAESEAELEDAELTVESFFQNPNPGTAIMDLKVDDTGDVVFLGTQPFTALFNEVNDDPQPNLQPQSTAGANSGGVVAVDVSDPSSPQLIDAVDGFSTGIHNLCHHRIDGTDYVLACKDIAGVAIGGGAGDASTYDGGLYILQLDRTAGALAPVNHWTPSGNLGDGVGTGSGDFYVHDVTIQDDPKTGTPTMYLSYWDAGLLIFDVSDPTNLEQIGLFPILQAHYAVPAPDTVTDPDGNERRVAFASHEEPSVDHENPRQGKANPGSSGTIYLVDTDEIYESEGVTECGELANWTWQRGVSFENYNLSPHNSNPAFHDGELWLHQGHYHGGTRFLTVDPGRQRGTTITDDGDLGEGPVVTTDGRYDPPVSEANWSTVDGVPADRDNDATDWRLPEAGFSRPVREVPEESKMTGLSTVQPNVWAAVQNRGVTFAGDINQGVFAIKHDDVPLGGPLPTPEANRETEALDGDVLEVRLTIDADGELLVRDRAPASTRVVGADGETYHLGGQTAVEVATSGEETLRYRVDAADLEEAGADAVFGPVEFSDDGGGTWHALSGTIETRADVTTHGLATPRAVTLGTAAGATAMTYAQRERIREGLGTLLDDE